jgi:hypothetical protein
MPQIMQPDAKECVTIWAAAAGNRQCAVDVDPLARFA